MAKSEELAEPKLAQGSAATGSRRYGGVAGVYAETGEANSTSVRQLCARWRPRASTSAVSAFKKQQPQSGQPRWGAMLSLGRGPKLAGKTVGQLLA